MASGSTGPPGAETPGNPNADFASDASYVEAYDRILHDEPPMMEIELPPSLQFNETTTTRPELQPPTPTVEPVIDEDARFAANKPRLRYIGICFLLQFLAYFTMQSLVTSLFPSYGAMAVAAIYLGYATSCLIGPMIVQKFGPRLTLTVASSIYATWIASSLLGMPPVMIFFALCLGLAGGPLWIAQGVYVSGLAQGRSVGRYNGDFLAVSFIADIVGPILSGVIFGGQQTETRIKLVLATMALIGYIASAMMWFIKPVDPPAADATSSTPTRSTGLSDILPRLKFMFKIATERRLMFVNLYVLSFGVGLAWAWGWLPTLVPLPLIPWYLVSYGVAVYLAAWQSGPIYDKRGWFPLLGSHLVLAAVGYVITPIVHTRGILWPLGITFFCCGIIEAIGTNLIQSTIMKKFDQETVGDALGVYRFLSGLSTGVTMLSGLSYAPLMLISFALLAVGAPLLAYNEIIYDNEKEQQKNEEEKSRQIDKARLNVDAAISVAAAGEAAIVVTPTKQDDGLYH